MVSITSAIPQYVAFTDRILMGRMGGGGGPGIRQTA